MEEMLEVVSGTSFIDDKLSERLAKGFAFCSRDKNKSIDMKQAEANLQNQFEKYLGIGA